MQADQNSKPPQPLLSFPFKVIQDNDKPACSVLGNYFKHLTRKLDTRRHACPRAFFPYLHDLFLFIGLPCVHHLHQEIKENLKHKAMALKSKLLLVALLLSVLFLSVYVASATQDPELKQCRHQCKQQQGFDSKQREQCEQGCDKYIKQKREEEKHRRKSEGEGGGGSFYPISETGREQEEEEEFQGRQQQDQNPYFFEDEHFETRVLTEEGRFQLLQKFTERSDLLRAIENYRIGFLVTKPHAFVAPSHFDADTVLFVFQGK